ncbi:lytic transglycosylase domain-containing protein [Streptomyces tropicalis]|uniref:Lytic transglycosylase domain-containing protein n=1 Tax=Streptomyces tropicalis TaxID=3034234 RepID=A0ABT6A7L5_9ACTN|nr:lytic transglycosylase domain-containing protein [Streptomyces tropicalis]MDF3300645.1 lytic transglycosylase domain-containing protein [Streptomyces tropicalis]
MTARALEGALKGARGTAIAVAVTAVLTASQAPSAVSAGVESARRAAPAAHPLSVSGDTPYRIGLPPLRTRRKGSARGVTDGGGVLPVSVFAAYRRAEEELARSAPRCGLRWQVLAAIGQVESGQARGGRVTGDGTTVTPILGPRLTGGAFAVVADTDGGAYDGDAAYDRAVGPMQFIPSTWARWGADGNGDGRADPNNVYDAALAAGRYLCAGGRDLSNPADLDAAILGYNHSDAYLRTVEAWYAYYLTGHRVVPDASGGSGSERPKPSRPKRPHPSPPKRSENRTPGPGRSRAPSEPSPSSSPGPSPTAGLAKGSGTPPIPVPKATLTLPGGGLLPHAGPLTTGNGWNTMGVSPSTTATTRR